jgi:hypothetical protein
MQKIMLRTVHILCTQQIGIVCDEVNVVLEYKNSQSGKNNRKS